MAISPRLSLSWLTPWGRPQLDQRHGQAVLLVDDFNPASNLPWYFRTSVIVIAILSVGPLALPLVWWHPTLKPAWKAGITLATLVLTWLMYQSMIESLKMLEEMEKALKGM